jgi:Carboxypeptidase regulatory-like domain
MKRVSLSCLAMVLMAFLMVPALLLGQQGGSGGTITGRVSDQTGAIVPDATVTLTDVATRSSSSATSNSAGLYVFSDVKPATYNVTVTKSGFQKAVLNGQTVTVGATLNLNVTLNVGTTTQVVEVTTTPGAELQTMNSTMGTSLGGDTIMQLPTFSRDATSLLYYQPTAVPDFNGATSNVTSGTVAGQESDQNTYSVDGGNATDDLAGENGYVNGQMAGTAAIPTPVESIQEFKVTDTNATADFADSTGGHVMLVTKSGTDKFHGSLYDYMQNSALDSNDWSNNFTGQPKPWSTYNRFGGAIGGPMLPTMLGGKTYFYFNYEGFRWPQTSIVERDVPSPLMRQGILQFRDGNNKVVQYNLATSTQCGPTGGKACDPLGIGLNPTIAKLWSQDMPAYNDTNAGDRLNTFGFQGPVSIPQKDAFLVGRVDHSFGSKLRWFSSYRWYDATVPDTNQYDIGGLVSGDKLGQIADVSSQTEHPRYFVTGLTATITPTLTNDFHLSYLRDEWQWIRGGFNPQVSGISVPLELGDNTGSGEPNGTTALTPVNINTQNARSRLWNGHDWVFRDGVSWLKGNHYLQFGGEFNHDWWHFNRFDDVVSGLTNTVIDQIGWGGGADISMPSSAQPIPCSGTLTSNCLPSGELKSWNSLYATSLGIVDQTNALVSRTGNNLNLNPIGTPLASYMIDNEYQMFASDSWRIKPSFTLSLGLTWGYQTPPYDVNGRQDTLTDSSGSILTVPQYLQNRETAAEAGNTYAPVIGFEPVGDVNGGTMKYPYQPFYGGFQPRIAAAWSPHAGGGFLGKILGNDATVIRGGYSRFYDRGEAIALVTNSVLGDGFLQPAGCTSPSIAGACTGAGGTTPSTAFRIGINGSAAPLPAIPQTLPLPVEPGVNAAYIGAYAFGINNNLPPGYADEFNLTVQRQFKGNVLVEVGWVGNWDHNLYQGVDLNVVPFMMKRGGQTFAQAFDNLYNELNKGKPVTTQPFFENALAGSSYCAGFSSCTAAVAANEGGNGDITGSYVTNVWSDLDSSFNFANTAYPGPQLLADTQTGAAYFQTSDGFGNYNALTATVQKRGGNGLTLSGSFTYGKALGTAAYSQTYTLANVTNPYNVADDYGPQYFDRKFIANVVASYDLPFGPGRRFLTTSNPVLKRLVGGWTIAPIFSIMSGAPLSVYTGSFQSFGQGFYGNGTNAIPLAPLSSFSSSAHSGVNPTGGPSNPNNVGVNGAAANGGNGENLFANPVQVYSEMEPCFVGECGGSGGAGYLRSTGLWNLDFSINKTTKITERVNIEFFSEWFNALNHMAWGTNYPTEDLQDPYDFGTLGQFNPLQGSYTRIIQLGLRLSF